MADKRSEKIVDEMSSAIDVLGRYEVSFTVESGVGSVVDGSYIVDRELYKLTLADQNIYGDGEQRFTIDNANREVVMERLDSSIPMVIANPARAFSDLNKSFESEIIESNGGDNICVMFTPREESELIDNTLIEIDQKSKLPLSARYRAGEEVLFVKILKFEPANISLISLDEMSLPDGYDIIDIR